MNSKVLFCFVLMFAVALATIGYEGRGYGNNYDYGMRHHGGYRGGYRSSYGYYRPRRYYYYSRPSYYHYRQPYYHRRRYSHGGKYGGYY